MTVVVFIDLAIYFFCTYVVLKRFFGYIPKTNSIVCIVLTFYTVLAVISIFFLKQFPYILAIIGTMVNIIVLKYVFSTAKIRSIICTFLCLYSLNITLSSLILFLIQNQSNRMINETISLLIDLLLLIIFFITNIIKDSTLSIKLSLIPLSVKRITLSSLFLSSFIVSLMSDYNAVNDINKWGISIRVFLSLLVIVLGAVFPILITNSIGKSFYAKQSKELMHQIQTQADHYESLSQSNYELRRFRHDYNNMRIGVNKLVKDQDYVAVQKVLEDWDNEISTVTNSILRFDTGNGIVDALLTEKQIKATSINTAITFIGTVPTSSIAPTDLCIIFGNSLDNAIEACEKLQIEEVKEISIISKCIGEYMFIKIINPVTENIIIHNNSLTSTKADKSSHGFGIYSLKQTIKKYNGDLSLSCNNNVFCVEISIELCK